MSYKFVQLFNALGDVSIFLDLVLAILLLRGSYRKYSLILTYCIVQLILTAGEYYFIRSNFYQTLYWTDEIVVNLLLFLMVITFTYRALGDSPMRQAMGKLLAAVFVVILALPLLIFKKPFSTPWFNHTSQLLSFGAAILNLGLWSALAANRQSDPQLFSVSAGLGVAVTGAAISYGVRGYVSRNWIWLPDVFMSATFLACMCIWCWAFRSKAAQPAAD